MTAESEVLGHDVSGREMTNEEKVLRRIKEAGEDGITAQRLRKDLEISVSDTSNIIAGLEFKKLIKLRKEGIEWYWCAVDAPELAAPVDDDRVACPVRGCRARIKNERENLGNHLNIAHGGMPPRDRVVMLDRMYPRPPSPMLKDLKAEMEAEDEGKEEPKDPAPAKVKASKKPKKAKAKGPSKHESPIQKRDHAQEAKNKLASKAERVATAERIACPIDGCKSRPIRDKSNVRAHLRAFHKLPLVEIHARLEQIFGAEGGEESNAVQSPATEPAVEPVQDVQEEPVYTELPTELPTEQPAGELPEASVDHVPEPEATHRCKICGCLWAFHPAGTIPGQPNDSWQMLGQAKACCDNAVMGEQIEPIEAPSSCVECGLKCFPVGGPDRFKVPPCEGDGCTIALPPMNRKDDPFVELVRRHRVRVGREISKLKRVERKLRRRAAAAESMADRVKVARRTKEKELDRFEREVAEVKGQ